MTSTPISPVTPITKGSLSCLHLKHPSGLSTASISLYGGQLFSWTVCGEEILFLSPNSFLDDKHAIRGGIPVVFPQFGPGPLVQHGFARTSTWKFTDGDVSLHKESGDVSLTLHLSHSEETMKLWPFKFSLQMNITLKKTSIAQQLVVNNVGDSPFDFTTLLHTYIRVTDGLSKVRVRGLANKIYKDKVLNGEENKESREEITFGGEEIDRVYIGGAEKNIIYNDGGNGEILMKCTGFKDLVVWNPGKEKAAAMKDLGEESTEKFVCLEAGSVAEKVTLQAGGEWKGAQGLSIQMVQKKEESDDLRDRIQEIKDIDGKL